MIHTCVPNQNVQGKYTLLYFLFLKNEIIKHIEILFKKFIKIPNFNDLINLLKQFIIKIHIKMFIIFFQKFDGSN